MPTVLVLQHAAAEGPAGIAEAVRRAGLDVEVVRIDRGDAVPDTLGAACGLVVMGGPMGAYETDRFPHLAAEIRLVERAFGDGAPVLGVCLGSQLLARALGAEVAPGPAPEIGWHPVETLPAAADDPAWRDVPHRFDALHWHGDVFALPDGAVALARSEATRVQAFRHGAAVGVLFHGEATPAVVRGMARAFPADLAAAGLVPSDVLDDLAARVSAAAAAMRPVYDGWAAAAARRGVGPRGDRGVRAGRMNRGFTGRG